MYKGALNTIIIISAIGLGLLVLYDIVTKDLPNTYIEKDHMSVVDSPIETKTDVEIKCKHDYFNFNKGTTWKYKLTNVITANSSTKIFSEEFKNTIIEASSASVLINSRSKFSESNFMVLCKKSGIYGFPFRVIVSSDLFEKNQINTEYFDLLNLGSPSNFTIDVQLIPSPNILYIGSSWEDTANIKFDVPIIGKKTISFPFSNSVNKQNRKKETITIQSAIVTDKTQNQIPFNKTPMLGDIRISRELKKNVGITKLFITLDLEGDSLKSKIELVEFFSQYQKR